MLGFHVRKEGSESNDLATNLQESVRILSDYDFQPCAQIFVTGPKSYKEIKMNKDKIKEIMAPYGLVIHGSYIDNPWGDSIHRKRAIKNIRREMKIAEDIGANGVIVHLGAGINNDNILKEVISGLRDSTVTLWLEINAAKPSEGTFETPSKIRKLYDSLQNINTTIDIGLCIDTAHLHSCGVSISTYNQAITWLGGLPPMKYMLHLNDSESVLGSGQDRHAALCQGNIWGEFNIDNSKLPISESGLTAFCLWAKKHALMTILERKTEYIPADLRLLHTMRIF